MSQTAININAKCFNVFSFSTILPRYSIQILQILQIVERVPYKVIGILILMQSYFIGQPTNQVQENLHFIGIQEIEIHTSVCRYTIYMHVSQHTPNPILMDGCFFAAKNLCHYYMTETWTVYKPLMNKLSASHTSNLCFILH